jgi:hypothetical protein
MVEATGGVSASEAYQDFEKKNNRFVNMLSDNVRPIHSLIIDKRIETFADRGLKALRNRSVTKRIAK